MRPLVDSLGTGILETRLKPKSGLIELDIPMETNRFYDEEKGEKWNKVDRQTFGGVLKTGQGKYMVGVFKDDELHVSPIDSVAQLRPQFKYFDKHVLGEQEVAKSLKTDPSKPREARQIHMTAKSSGDHAPRFSGALEARRAADDEVFVKLDWFDKDSAESWEMGDKLVTSNKRMLQSELTLHEYTDKLRL